MEEYIVAIVGSRHRGFNSRVSVVDHVPLIESILAPRISYWGERLCVVSIYCDRGFGKAVRDYCDEHGVKFMEYVVYFNGPRLKTEYARAYLGRHAAIVEVTDEYHVAVSNTRHTAIEDLVERVRASGKPYALYNDASEVLEYYSPEPAGEEAHEEKESK